MSQVEIKVGSEFDDLPYNFMRYRRVKLPSWVAGRFFVYDNLDEYIVIERLKSQNFKVVMMDTSLTKIYLFLKEETE